MSISFRQGTGELIMDRLRAVIEEGEGEPSAIALNYLSTELESDRRNRLIEEEDYWLLRITLGLRRGRYTQGANGVIEKAGRPIHD